MVCISKIQTMNCISWKTPAFHLPGPPGPREPQQPPEAQDPAQPDPILDAGKGVSPDVFPANLRIFSANSGVGFS